MNNPYTSDTLHHFVGHAHPTDHQRNFNVLKKVLSARRVWHPPHENNHGTVSMTFNWDCSLISEKRIVPTVTCYAEKWSQESEHGDKWIRSTKRGKIGPLMKGAFYESTTPTKSFSRLQIESRTGSSQGGNRP